MDFSALIDAIVRQTTVLIAHLATAAGVRAPLAHVANQVFLELVRELEAQGLGRKVVADMFGIALRSYQLKVQRLSESATDRQRTLWNAALDFIQASGPVSRTRVLQRFAHDDEGQVRAVLHDLVESGLVYRTGGGVGTAYRAASPEDLGEAFGEEREALAAPYVWMVVYRYGPATRETIGRHASLPPPVLAAALDRLVAEGRVTVGEEEGEEVWSCETCFVPQGTAVGWEAAVFDHFQALVAALCMKLSKGAIRSLPDDVVGGSTWSFDIWPGHPDTEAVQGLMRRLRGEVSALRARVTAYNDAVGRPEGADRVTFYLGQSMVRGRVDDGGGA
ncbi:MAG: hypothetical protein H6706_02580 [Myxococcales bacterium]|nr:hypothetical protein [Myxococcales bacterium]